MLFGFVLLILGSSQGSTQGFGQGFGQGSSHGSTKGSTQPHIAVLDVKPRAGVTAGLAAGVTDALVAQVRRRQPQASVIGTEEMRSMIGFERQRQTLGCQSTSCLAEIGGALGAESLIIGTLARFGRTYLLSLQLVDVRSAKVKREASLELDGNSDESLLGGVTKAVEELFPPAVAAPSADLPLDPWAEPAEVDKPSSGAGAHALAWSLIGLGAASAIVAGIGGLEVLSYNSFNQQLTNQTEAPGSAVDAQSRRNQAQTWGNAGLVLAGLAVACGVGAVFAW